MAFPTLWQFVSYNHWLLLFGPVILLITTWRFRQGRYRTKGKSGSIKLFIEGTMGILLTFFALNLFLNFWRWQSIFRQNQVQAVRITCIDGEPNELPGQSFLVEESQQINQELQALTDVSVYRRNHQTFFQGYRLQFRFQGEASFSNAYIAVYSTDQSGHRVPIIIPHLGQEHLGLENELGNYESSEFLVWLSQKVDTEWAQPCHNAELP